MSRIAGCTALVTGGASGIGFLVGSRLLGVGLERLVVWDLDEEALGRAVDGWRSRGHKVNALAPMHLVRAVLPGMVDRGKGHIVNVSSAAAMVSTPGMSVYCASKWALAGWSDSLRLEIERARTGIRVTTVLPYYIDTGMFEGVRSRFIPILEPDAVARQIVSGIRKDRIFVRLPRRPTGQRARVQAPAGSRSPARAGWTRAPGCRRPSTLPHRAASP